MHIETIHIERSGALANVTIDALGPGVQVLHGTNETGKTSLLEFVRAMFFGFEGLFRRGVLDPRRPCAGRLVVHVGPEGRRLAIERRHEGPGIETLTRAAYEDGIVGLGGDEGDFISVVDVVPPVDGRPWNRPYLQDVVGEIDERTFTNVMAFGLDELHELRTLEPEGCGSRLYELAAGLDRSKVTRVIGHIHESLARLDSADPAVSPIESLRLRRHELLDRIAALNSPALVVGGLLAELAHTDTELAAAEAAVARSIEAEDVIRGVLPLEPLYRDLRSASERLAALVGTTLVHGDLDGWKRAARLKKRLARLVRRRQKTRSRLARSLEGLADESPLWKRRAAVAAICEEQPRLERLVAEVSRAEAHARLAARRFGEQLGQAGLARIISLKGPLAALDSAADAALDALPDVLLPEGFSRSFRPLRARARGCREASRAVAAAKRGVAEAKGVLDDTRGIVKGAATGKGQPIAAAIEEAGGRVTLYRNRIAAASQLAELDRALARLDHELTESVGGQLLPVPWLLALGAVFVPCAALLLSGLLLPAAVTGPWAYALAALGLAGTGAASVTTWTLDRSASSRLDAARSQRAMVQKQREELLTQCAALDRRIPGDAVDSLERRLAAAQAELERLEELAAREGSMHLLSDKVALAVQELRRAVAARKAARGRWRKALEQRGLPVTLSPREVRQIGLHRHALLTLDDDRRRLSDEARQRREDLAAFARRIDGVMVECELVPEGTPLEHLALLRERLEAASAAHRRRVTLTRKLERARAAHRRGKRQLAAAEHQLKDFLTRWNAATAEEFLAKVDRRPLFDRTRREADAAEAAWLEARRRVTGPPDLDHWLAGDDATDATDSADATPLEARLARACAATDRLRATLALARDRRGAIAAKVEAASRDRAPEPLQAELADVEDQLAQQLDRRRLLERTGGLLEETRLAVARDHQPPALREASHWLSRLTDGRYIGITTTIDEARLEVHERDGTTWNPERLSRGTREQVFLALRLALVRDLQRHGIRLPVVMDDALVNFDDERARIAARVLVDFAADLPGERQVLAFTCHAHVAQLFADAGAEVRSLADPHHRWRRPAAEVPAAPRLAVAVPEPRIVPLPPVERTPPPPRPVAFDDPHATWHWPAEEFFFSPTGGYAAEHGDDETGREPPHPARTAPRSRRGAGPRRRSR